MSRCSLAALAASIALSAAPGCDDSVRFREDPTQFDTFQQTPSALVDILWVVDNSGTMVEERAMLGEKFDQFMGRLVASGTDYHIGIISTDTEDLNHSGKLQGDPRVITPATPDPKAAFAANVQLPQTASRIEKGLEAARLALSDELLAGHNAGFLRAEASLFVIVVSDEDDQSRGPIGYYSRWLEHIKGTGNENLVSLSSIVGPMPSGCGDTSGAGERYIQVQELTGGLFHSICSEDYGLVVDELGVTAAGLVRKFYLSEIPQVDTLQVLEYLQEDPVCELQSDCEADRVCGAGYHCARALDSALWIYQESDNAIFFAGEYLPPASAFIEVAYYRLGG